MPPADIIDADKITEGLGTKRIGRTVIVFGAVTSTNDIAAQYAQNPKNDGMVILAEEQTSGRGRGGNKWYSGKGESLLCSIILHKESISAELLSLTAAVAAAEAISDNARVKWPNDIILNGKKVAGILLESKQTEQGAAYILGVGINCHQEKFDGKLSSIATSIDIETHQYCNRSGILKRLLHSIEDWLEISHKKPQDVIDEWGRLSILLGRRITLSCNGREFCGNCVGIDPDEGLIVELDSGARQFFHAGHTSIIK